MKITWEWYKKYHILHHGTSKICKIHETLWNPTSNWLISHPNHQNNFWVQNALFRKKKRTSGLVEDFLEIFSFSIFGRKREPECWYSIGNINISEKCIFAEKTFRKNWKYFRKRSCISQKSWNFLMKKSYDCWKK